MSLDNSAVVPFTGGGYTIDQSLIFNDDDSAYLSRSFSAGNRKTWTWSGWFKRGSTNIPGSTYNHFLFGGISNTYGVFYRENPNDPVIEFNPGNNGNIETTLELRDHSAWYHMVAVFDCTNATSSERMRLYLNGVRITSADSNVFNMPNYDTDAPINQATTHYMGKQGGLGRYFDGYQAECHFIDGQALTADDFGEFGDYGEWKPKKYTGSYGTTGFYLDFGGTYYNDKSGNGNNWTANNLASTDVVLDSPTNNFCTWNPLLHNDAATYSQGNLAVETPNYPFAQGTMWVSSGKWYWEWTSTGGSYPCYNGICNKNKTPGETAYENNQAWYGNGDSYVKQWGDGHATLVSTPSLSTSDIRAIAVDLDNGTVKFYQNNTLVNTDTSLPVGEEITPMFYGTNDGSSGSGWSDDIFNFGQDSSFAGNKTAQGNSDGNGVGDFYYTPPSGYLALCTANLPDPDVIPSEHFNTVVYTGNNTYPRNINVGFQADLVWIKDLTGYHWRAFDRCRGTAPLYLNNTNVEDAANDGPEVSTSNYSSGFQIIDNPDGTSGTGYGVNYNGNTITAFAWKGANGTSSNTNGSITSTVSANQDAGCSIVSYTGNGSTGATVGHGLSSAPEMVIIKNRDQTGQWQIYHHGINAPNAEDYFLMLNSSNSAADDGSDSRWNDTDPSSTVVTLGNDWEVNNSTKNFIMYCFHSVDGFSKVNSYTGNGSTDGVFVHTGFRPKFIIVKKYSGGESWETRNTVREPYNETEKRLIINSSNAEGGNTNGDRLDILSNGFKARDGAGQWNESGASYIYIAFAETPFKYANAR